MKNTVKTIIEEIQAFAIGIMLIFAFTGIGAYMQIPASSFALGLVCWLFGREIMKSTRKN